MPDTVPLQRPDPLNRRTPQERGFVHRFLGGSVLGTAVKLAAVSVLVGMVMNFFGWSPHDLLWALEDAVRNLWDAGFAAFDSFVGYFLLGAAVVIPVFFLLRLLSFRR